MPIHFARLTVLAAFLAALFHATPAAAQGTDGVFPDPLDWRTFQELAVPLSLSPDQLQALESHHQRYLEAMMVLRDGQIAEFMEGMGKHGEVLDQDDRKERINTYRKIARQMASTEETFLDGLAPVLGPSQVETLDVVKDWRERQRILGTPWPWSSWSSSTKQLVVELRTCIDWGELDEADREAVEAALASHEAIRTRLARQLFEQRLKGRIRELDNEENLGQVAFAFEEDGSKGEEAIRQWEMEHLARHHEAYGAAIKTSQKLRKAYHDGINALVGVLPDRAGRDFRWKAWQRAYRVNDSINMRDMIIHSIDKAGDSGVDVAALKSLLADHDARTRPHAEDLIEYEDENAQQQGGSFSFMKSGEGEPARLARTAMQEDNFLTGQRLHALLGDKASSGLVEWLGYLERQEPGDGEPIERYGGSKSIQISVVVGGAATAGDDGELDPETAQGFMGKSSGLDRMGAAPDPISASNLEHLGQDLEFDENGQDIMDVLYDAYARHAAAAIREYEAKRNHLMMSLAASMEHGEVKEEDSFMKFMDFDRQMTELQQSVVAQMRRLDMQFFDDLVLAIDSTDDQAVLHWHRLARRRTHATAPSSPMGASMAMVGGATSESWRVDLMQLLGTSGLGPAQRKTALAAMRDWHEPATAAMETIADLERTQSSIFREMAEIKQDENAEQDYEVFMEPMRRVEENTSRREQVTGEMKELNERMIEQVVAALPTDAGIRLRREWREASFPAIYIDPRRVHDKLLATMELEDLEESTRADLLVLHNDYTGRYETACDQLVVLFEDLPQPAMMGKVDLEGLELRDRSIGEAERIRFERDDLSDKTRDRLRNMLTEAQVEAIGGLEASQLPTMHWPRF